MPTANHLSREDWIAAARRVLVRSGIDDVKVDRLAKKLKVTRGSFYWHFEHRKDLLDAVLDDWISRNRVEIELVEERWKITTPDLSEVVAIWLGEDPTFPAFDMAIRAWARKAAPVMTAVARVDEAWIALLERLFRSSGMGEEESLVRARVVYFHQIGYYALGVSEDFAERLKLAPVYYRVLTGREPTLAHAAVLASFTKGRSRRVRRKPEAAAESRLTARKSQRSKDDGED